MTDAPVAAENQAPASPLDRWKALAVAAESEPAESEASASQPDEDLNAAADEAGGEIVSADPVEPAGEPGDQEESDEQEPAAAASAVEAPYWWDAEAKAHFAALPPEVQDIVRNQEVKRGAVFQREKDAVKEAAKAARENAERAKAIADQLSEVMPDQEAQFRQYYEGINWKLYAQQDPDAAQAEWNQYQQGLLAFKAAEDSRAQAEQVWRDNFYREEGEKLHQIAPELVENEGRVLRDVADFLVKEGVDNDRLPTIGALEWSLAYDAMRWRRAEAAAKAKAEQPPRNQPLPTPRIAPPGAPPARTGTSQQREHAKLREQHRKNPTRETTAALLKAGIFN